MKPNPFRYLGESIPRHGSALLGDAESAWDAAAAGAAVVRSSTDARRLANPAFDLAAIEREARAAQSEWVARAVKSFFVALARKLMRRGNAKESERPASAQGVDAALNHAPSEKAPLPRSVAHTF